MKRIASVAGFAIGFLALLPRLSAAAPGDTFARDRVLRADVIVPAPIDSVWAAWTTEAGIRSFFAPAGRIEPRVDGAFEIYFNPDGAPGEKGAEGTRILAFEPPSRLAFTWNAPPKFPDIRAQRTMVIVELEPVSPTKTRLRMTQTGWGRGAHWDATYDYFDHAWNGQVLPLLVYRFEHGPIDWNAMPERKPVVASMKTELAPANVKR